MAQLVIPKVTADKTIDIDEAEQLPEGCRLRKNRRIRLGTDSVDSNDLFLV